MKTIGFVFYLHFNVVSGLDKSGAGQGATNVFEPVQRIHDNTLGKVSRLNTVFSISLFTLNLYTLQIIYSSLPYLNKTKLQSIHSYNIAADDLATVN